MTQLKRFIWRAAFVACIGTFIGYMLYRSVRQNVFEIRKSKMPKTSSVTLINNTEEALVEVWENDLPIMELSHTRAMDVSQVVVPRKQTRGFDPMASPHSDRTQLQFRIISNTRTSTVCAALQSVYSKSNQRFEWPRSVYQIDSRGNDQYTLWQHNPSEVAFKGPTSQSN